MSRRRLKRVIDEFPGGGGGARRGLDGIPRPKHEEDITTEESDDDLGHVLDEYEQDQLIKNLVVENEKTNYQTRVIYIVLAGLETILFVNPFPLPLSLSHPCRYKYPLMMMEAAGGSSSSSTKCASLADFSGSPFTLDPSLSILAVSSIWACVYWLNYIDPESQQQNNTARLGLMTNDDDNDDSLTNYLNPRPLKLQHSSPLMRYITPLNAILAILCAVAAYTRFILPRWRYIDYTDSTTTGGAGAPPSLHYFFYDTTPPGFSRRILFIMTVVGPYAIYLLPFANVLAVLWLRYWINSVDVYGLARFRYKYKGA